MRPKGVLTNWSCQLSPEDLLKRTEDTISLVRNTYDSVACVHEKEVTFSNVLKVLDEAELELRTQLLTLGKMHNFADDEKIRTASRESDKKFQDFDVEISMNQAVFKKLVALQKKNEDLSPEYRRYLEKLVLEGKRNGLHLSDEKRKEIKELKNRLTELGISFMSNIQEDSTTLEFSMEELDGVPKDVTDSLEKLDNGKIRVSMQYPEYFPVMQKCRNPETRKALYVAFNERCKEENKPILTEGVKLRYKLANLLDYPNHVAYATEVLMSKSDHAVEEFLTEIGNKLQPLWKKERELMLELKKKECEDLNLPFDGTLHPYDFAFYTTKVTETKYALDETKLKEYFPVLTVTKGLCDIYQHLLGLKFTEIEDAEVWHKDVKMFSVEDSNSDELLGYFFLDLFPRKGKYNHACVEELQPSCLKPDGTRQVAVAVMITNFVKPQPDRPSLLSSSEVTTYFHEFGHLMHYICTKADSAFFHAFATERDFVEAPSQMLENWCYEVEPLRKMSGHYQDKSEIPDNLLQALIESRLANTGYSKLRQIALATFDYRIHASSGECDVDQVYADVNKELMDLETIEGTSMPSTFSHMFNEYDASYYGYMWSEVYSVDMFYTCFKDGKTLDPTAGKNYREKILEPGSSKDAIDMLVDFLGREPTKDAFLKSQGLL